MRGANQEGRGHVRKGLKVSARYPANCQPLQTEGLLTKTLRLPFFFFFKGRETI